LGLTVSNFVFRLRFNFAPSFRINSEQNEMPLCTLGTGQTVVLKSGQTGTSIKECDRAVVRAEGFQSEVDARAAAEWVKRTLLYWAVRYRHGIDLGDRKPEGLYTTEGLKMLEEEHGCEFRNDRHGIDIFEHKEGLRFIRSKITAIAQKHPDRLLSTFDEAISAPRAMTDRQMLACEIYCSSWFDVNYKSRFITLVTAMEALLEQQLHPEPVQSFVNAACESLQSANLPEPVRASLKGSLERMRQESISHAGRRMASELLPNAKINDLLPSECFTKLYGLRSQLVHDGAPGKDDQVRLASNTAEEFVAKLLLASLGGEVPA
jgi:hypothetical protein